MLVRLLALFVFACPALGYRYLVVFPMPSGSHNILGKGVVKALTDAGHQVTHITPIPDKNPHKQVEQIDVSFLFSIIKDSPNIMNNEPMMSFSMVKQFAYNISTQLIENDVIQSLLGDKSRRYDAVITEWFFSDFYAGFAQVFQCPWLHLAPAGMISSLEYLVDEVQSPATSPSLITGFTVPMTFKQRLINSFLVYYGLFETIFFDHPREEAAYERLFSPAALSRGVTLPPFRAAIHNISVLFVNSHPALGQTLRLPANVVQVAGYYIDQEVKPLPKSLQETLDAATSGAIYFSMGSNLKSADMPDSTKEKLLRLFAKLKIAVIWKFESQLADAPPNLHIDSWLPQQSILAHKNVKVFITHGGLGSVTEAVNFGVPLIAVPIFGDQFSNAQRAQKQGFAIEVNYRDDDFVEQLEEALNKMLRDPSYHERAKYLSQLFHDRLVPASRLISYWAEYAVRTGGAQHLRSPALVVPAYQRWLLDVAALAIAVIALAFVAVRFTVRRLIALSKRGEATTTKKRSKKNN